MRGGLVATDGSGREDPAGFAEPVVSLRMADGSEVHRPLRDVRARQVVAAVPWRGTRSARGQAHYPGCYWSATTSAHVIYESRLETVTGTTLLRTDPGMPITLTPEGEQFAYDAFTVLDMLHASRAQSTVAN
jgi:hypothetical protein